MTEHRQKKATTFWDRKRPSYRARVRNLKARGIKKREFWNSRIHCIVKINDNIWLDTVWSLQYIQPPNKGHSAWGQYKFNCCVLKMY